MPVKIIITSSFDRDYQKLPQELQRVADKQIELLSADLAHPSLRLKKLGGHAHTWEIRISKGYRILIEFEGSTMILYRVGPHNITRRPV